MVKQVSGTFSYKRLSSRRAGEAGEPVFEKRFTRTCTDFSRRVQKDFLYGAVLFELKQDPEVPQVIARTLLALPNGSEVALHEFCSQLLVVCLPSGVRRLASTAAWASERLVGLFCATAG